MKRPSLSPGHSYRILAVGEDGNSDLVGRVLHLESAAVDISLPTGFLSVTGQVLGGQEVKDCPLALEPTREQNCHCPAFSFPHRRGPRCFTTSER